MDTFNALADPTRRSILEMLAHKGYLSSTAIAEKFNVSPPAISQHLKVLRESKLVKMEKQAQQHIYRINPEKMGEVEHWAQKLIRQWEERFDRLDAVLQEEKKKILKSYSKQLKK